MSQERFQHARFLGAEGIGMSALIKILAKQQPQVKISKSDLSYKQNDPLDDDIDLVVRSTAIGISDSDYLELKSRGLPIWHRRDMLNYLSKDHKQIVVSGTHGKTTCSAMLAHILVELGFDPSFAVGGILSNYASNARAGSGEYFVLEGDESDKSFTITNPYLALVTCIEEDHLENYPGGLIEIRDCFYKFLDSAQIAVVNIDDPLLKEYVIARETKQPSGRTLIRYSSSELNDYDIQLTMPGEYNKLNALGCIKAATAVIARTEQSEGRGNLPTTEAMLEALKSFTGIKRRFELINPNYNGIRVYDDYAHHPTEVKALLEGVLSLNPKRLVFVYQPHHPERTQQFWNDFVEVFQEFPEPHLCLIADIYVARSKHIPGINSARLVQEIGKDNVRYLAPIDTGETSQGNLADIVAALKPGIETELQDCDYLFIVGAGNIAKVAGAFGLELLKNS
ncbi:MAG: Mur ligase family protein [Cyanobacteria bacterium]|nr:Mur ligase family protein [Cyanobacteriota bacterium]MDA1021318.1 Mur ligase family protein [Cyanobacteriota bacterium]